MNRRTLLIGLAALPACAAHGRVRDIPTVLQRAVAAAGGDALARVRALRWTGAARVHGSARVTRIGVETRVVPFVSARSDSWRADQGPASRRSMIIEPAGGWIERDGRREAMPRAMFEHERQQYAIYGLMLLAPLLDRQVRLTPAGTRKHCVIVEHPQAPATTLCFAGDGQLEAAENRVRSPEGGHEIAQRFGFSGTLESAGIRWPRSMTIDQDGKRFFELELSSFTAEGG